MSSNYFNKFDIWITKEQAQDILELVQGMDFEKMTRQQVMSLNGLQYSLQAVIEEAKEEASKEETYADMFNNAFGIDIPASLDELTIRRVQ